MGHARFPRIRQQRFQITHGPILLFIAQPFDADEEDRRNDEDDEQEELERQERQNEEDGEDIYSDDLRGNFVRPALPIDRCTRSKAVDVERGG